MKKLLKRIGICLVLAASVWCGSLLADRQRLNDELIRFHVVANSDSEEDQSIKLQVRDAVLNSLQSDLNKIADVNEARAYLQAKLPQIQWIPAGAEHLDAAKQFVAYLYSDEACKLL